MTVIAIAIMHALAQACCMLLYTCNPVGPMPDGSTMQGDSCTQPRPHVVCDCEKYGWRKP